MKYVIGIDPGAKGVACAMDRETRQVEFYSFYDSGIDGLADFIVKKMYNGGCTVVLEEVHAIFGSSAKGTFKFGENFGYVRGVLNALKVGYTLIPPKQWQSAQWSADDKCYTLKARKKKITYADGGTEIVSETAKTIDTKKTSIKCARRKFPDVIFRHSVKCKVDDDNFVDSCLIADYGRMNNL